VLGKFQISNFKFKISEVDIKRELETMVGKFEQKYPRYSSKSFAGDYVAVRNGQAQKKLSHTVELYSAEFLEMREVEVDTLLDYITNSISKVVGDFRQEEIMRGWQEELSSPKFNLGFDVGRVFWVAKVKLKVSSGFYVRQFAEDLGKRFSVPALAYSIAREKVAEWGIDDCVC
jgi:tRNA U55 pseudouridine synthase TruB